MNSVILVGRLTRDPELRYTSATQTAVATFTLAVDRPFSKNNEADFLRIVVYGRPAENCSTYLTKGSQACVQGRIQTGSYTAQNGEKRYTTDIIAERVEFLQRASGSAAPYSQSQRESGRGNMPPQGDSSNANAGIPDGFHAFDEEDDDNIPF